MKEIHRKYPKPDKNKVIALYNDGLSIRKIANKLNTNVWQVREALSGIKYRPSGFRKGHKNQLGEKHWNWQNGDKIRGEKHYLWKGGISGESKRIRSSFHFRLWREAVFARDNWICQKCNRQGVNLNPHHILNFVDFPELRFAIDNGMTFCRDCHYKFHKKYGFKNNTKEHLEEFLSKNNH